MKVPEPVLAARKNGRLLHDRETVLRAIDRLAVRLTVALAEENPLLVCVMNGALPFTAALLQRLQFPLQLTYLHVSRYGHRTRGSELRWHARSPVPFHGRHVVLVDDILDEGVTLAALKAHCLGAGARAVSLVVLVDKEIAHPAGQRPVPDFAALRCPDRYVFGWGMDFEGYWRNLPDIYVLPRALETGREGG